MLYFILRKSFEDYDIVFAACLIFRNFVQFLRLLVLLKNQQTVRKNVEEIIDFNSVFDEHVKEHKPTIEVSNNYNIRYDQVNLFINEDMSNNKSIQVADLDKSGFTEQKEM